MKKLLFVRWKWSIGLTAALVILVYLVSDFMRGGEDVARPVIRAIERYHTLHGIYPDELSDVVKAGLLPSIPRMPWSVSTILGDLTYFADRDLDIFCLSYTEQPVFGGLGPARCEDRYYISFEKRWLSDSQANRRNLAHPVGLAMNRAGRMFRQTRSAKDLRLFVEKTMKYSYQESAYPQIISKAELVNALGDGQLIELNDRPCLRYSSDDKESIDYAFMIHDNSGLVGVRNELVVAILYFNRSESPATWREIFHIKQDPVSN
jgi:hypothetical protein